MLNASRGADIPGAAHLVLTNGVVHLDPEEAVFDAMLAGWQRQQRTRFLSDEGTIRPRLTLIRRMAEFTNSYPWQWQPADGEDFIVHLRSGVGRTPIAVSTARSYEMAISLFMEYVTDSRYGWPTQCLERFAVVPQQVFYDGNSVAHVTDYAAREEVEATDGRRGKSAITTRPQSTSSDHQRDEQHGRQ